MQFARVPLWQVLCISKVFLNAAKDYSYALTGHLSRKQWVQGQAIVYEEGALYIPFSKGKRGFEARQTIIGGAE